MPKLTLNAAQPSWGVDGTTVNVRDFMEGGHNKVAVDIRRPSTATQGESSIALNISADQAREVAAAFIQAAADATPKEPTIEEQFAEAIEKGWVVVFEYKSMINEASTRVFRPNKIRYEYGNVHGRDLDADEPRILKLSRIQRIIHRGPSL